MSWFVAVLFTPYIGYRCCPTPQGRRRTHDPYGGRALRACSARWSTWCVDRRWIDDRHHRRCLRRCDASLQLRAAAVLPGFQPAGADRRPVAARRARPSPRPTPGEEAREAARQDEDVDRYTTYVGTGAPRFYLPLDPQLTNPNLGQFIVMTRSIEARERVAGRSDAVRGGLRRRCAAASTGCRTARRSAYPVQFRVWARTRSGARRSPSRSASHARRSRTRDVNFDWNELAKVGAARCRPGPRRARSASTSSC